MILFYNRVACYEAVERDSSLFCPVHSTARSAQAQFTWTLFPRADVIRFVVVLSVEMAARAAAEWIPLESNPDVMNSYLRELGLSSGYAICDVFGTDPDLLMMVPQPVLGLILLFPIKEGDNKADARKISTATDDKDGERAALVTQQKF